MAAASRRTGEMQRLALVGRGSRRGALDALATYDNPVALVLNTDSGNDWLVYTGNETGDRLPVRVLSSALGKLQDTGIHIEHQAHFVALLQSWHHVEDVATDIVPAVAKSVGVSSSKVVPRLFATVTVAPRHRLV